MKKGVLWDDYKFTLNQHRELLKVVGTSLFNGVSLFGMLVGIYRSRLKKCFPWGSQPRPFSDFFDRKKDRLRDRFRRPNKPIFTAEAKDFLPYLDSFKKDWKPIFNQIASEIARSSRLQSVPSNKVVSYDALLSILNYFEVTDDVPIESLYSIGFDFADLACYLESYGWPIHSNPKFVFDNKEIFAMLRMHGKLESEASLVHALLKALGVSVRDLAGFFPSERPSIPIIKETPQTSDLDPTFCHTGQGEAWQGGADPKIGGTWRR